MGGPAAGVAVTPDEAQAHVELSGLLLPLEAAIARYFPLGERPEAVALLTDTDCVVVTLHGVQVSVPWQDGPGKLGTDFPRTVGLIAAEYTTRGFTFGRP